MSASFKAYDVRGIVGESITAESCEAVGAAFVDVLGLRGQSIFCGGVLRAAGHGDEHECGEGSQGAAKHEWHDGILDESQP